MEKCFCKTFYTPEQKGKMIILIFAKRYEERYPTYGKLILQIDKYAFRNQKEK